MRTIVTLLSMDPADVPTPATGEVSIFADSTDNNIPKYKDELAVVRVLSFGTASELGTTQNPVEVDGGPAPNVGDVLVASAGMPTPAALWQPPTAVPGVVKMRTGAPLTGAFATQVSRINRVALAGGNATTTLPSAVTNEEAEIWFKIVDAPGGNTLTISPAGGEDIDGNPSLVLQYTGEWAKLRALGTTWYQVG